MINFLIVVIIAVIIFLLVLLSLFLSLWLSFIIIILIIIIITITTIIIKIFTIIIIIIIIIRFKDVSKFAIATNQFSLLIFRRYENISDVIIDMIKWSLLLTLFLIKQHGEYW